MFEFIETPFFTKALDRYLDDDEYGELQTHLIKHPNSGNWWFQDQGVFVNFGGPPKGGGNVEVCG